MPALWTTFILCPASFSFSVSTVISRRGVRSLSVAMGDNARRLRAADSRCPEHHPIQTSAVLVLKAPQCAAVPPPSPPSPPVSPPEEEISDQFEELSLDAPQDDTSSAVPSPNAERRLSQAVHVLNTEAAALLGLTRFYETDPIARDGFNRAVEAITRHNGEKGKLVIIGVGKSGHIGKKLVATFNSLAMHSVFLHPTEALHGDLGTIGRHDTLMFITFSGKTQEILTLIPHLDKSLPIVLLTSHTRHDTCEFTRLRPDTILLPTPIHETETASFGVSAPTTSTTVALAVGDAVAITASKELHCSVSTVFARNHPGGAIGASFRRPQTVKDLAVPWADITDLEGLHEHYCTGADLLRAGYGSTTGWARLHDRVASPGRIRQLGTDDMTRRLVHIPNLLVSRDGMLSISADTTLRRAADLVRNMELPDDDGEYICGVDSIVAVVDKGEIIGVLEVRQLLDWEDSS